MKLLSAALFFAATVMTFPASTLAADEDSNLLRDPNALSRNDSQISGEKFLHAWLSKDNEKERLKANMYLMGVMDATEGRAWCSYKLAKPDSLRETVYAFFKELLPERQKEPASSLIKEALMQQLPCGK